MLFLVNDAATEVLIPLRIKLPGYKSDAATTPKYELLCKDPSQKQETKVLNILHHLDRLGTLMRSITEMG